MAFAADYATEAKLLPEAWQHRLEESTWVVEECGAEIVGLAGLVLPEPEEVEDHWATWAEVRYIESVWVAPERRWQGLALAMIEDLEQRARAEKVTQLKLWVINGNDGAWSAYLKMGFGWTGEEVQPPGRTYFERRMTKTLI